MNAAPLSEETQRRLAGLQDRFDAILADLQANDHLNVPLYERIFEDVSALAPVVGREEQQKLLTSCQRISVALEEARGRLASQLVSAKQGQIALRGYARAAEGDRLPLVERQA